MKMQLIATPPSGIVNDEDNNHVLVHPYINQIGEVIEENDTRYDTDIPTGYEPYFYLLLFEDGKKLWLPESLYFGDNHKGKEIWTKFLRKIND